MLEQSIYTVGGTVQAGGGIYIKRKADDELLNLCQQGEFAFILSSRQVGKSSLMIGTAQQLEHENIRSVIIDLGSIGVNISPDEWYLGILNEIQIDLNLNTDIFAWWLEHAQLGHAQRLTSFFRDVLLKEVSQRVVIFFDEIDSTLSIPFADDFFVALRAVYNARSTTPKFKRLSFVLIGVASPSDLISDNKRTPFNIGHRVELDDFTFEEALPLAEGLGAQAEQALVWVLYFTGGHPYLTQRLCAHLARFREQLTKQVVEGAVKQLFTGEQGKQDHNLQFVTDMLAKRSPDVRRVLLTYGNICSGKKVIDDEHSITKVHLKLSGLVRSENGFLRVRNKIYNSVFSNQWVHDNTPRNWPKIAAVSLSFITFVLLAILVFNFYIGKLSNQYAGEFYTSRAGSEKLKKLASLFKLQGILQNTDYDFRARELFYSLNWDEQIRLFQDTSIIQSDKQKYLPTIVNGLYVTMANIEGGQDSSKLLRIMKDSLKGLKTSESLKLHNEITLWLDARSAQTDQDALNKYNEVIQLNPNNPATRYERSRIEFRLDQYEQALIDLEATMALAQNLSTESSESEIETPTPWPTKIQLANIPLPTIEGSEGITLLTPPFQALTETVITPQQLPQTPDPSDTPAQVVDPSISTEAPPAPTQMPIEQPIYSVGNGYKSSFYSIAYIRSAIGLVMQEQISQSSFENVLIQRNLELPNLRNAGLLPELALNFTTGTANPTITDTAAPTATIPTFKARVSRPSYCRNGPSENYLNAPIVAAGTEVDVLGMNSDTEDWFMIQGATVGRCWIPSAFLNYTVDIENIPILTTALTTEDSPCRIDPREGRQAQTNIPPGWRIVINAKSNSSADWLLVTPHDSTEQCWVAKELLTSFADGSLRSVAVDVLILPASPTSTRRPNNGNNEQTPVQPTPVPPTPTLCWPPGHCK